MVPSPDRYGTTSAVPNRDRRFTSPARADPPSGRQVDHHDAPSASSLRRRQGTCVSLRRPADRAAGLLRRSRPGVVQPGDRPLAELGQRAQQPSEWAACRRASRRSCPGSQRSHPAAPGLKSAVRRPPSATRTAASPAISASASAGHLKTSRPPSVLKNQMSRRQSRRDKSSSQPGTPA